MAPHLVCPRTKIKRLPSLPVQNSSEPTMLPSACVQVFPALRKAKMSPHTVLWRDAHKVQLEPSTLKPHLRWHTNHTTSPWLLQKPWPKRWPGMASNIISKGARESAQQMMAVWGAWPSSTNWRRAACLVLEPNGRPSTKRRLPSFQGTGSDRSSHDSNLRRVHANSWTDSCQACAAKLQRSKLWVCLVFAAPSASTSGLWQLIYSKQLKCLSFWIFGCCCVKYGSFFNLWIAVLQELEGIFKCHWGICCCADLANLSRGAQGTEQHQQANWSTPWHQTPRSGANSRSEPRTCFLESLIELWSWNASFVQKQHQ